MPIDVGRRSAAALRATARRHLPHGRTLPEQEWRRRHNGILVLLWILGLALPLYGLARGHALSHDLAGGVTLLAVAALASRRWSTQAAGALLASYGLCLASALAVHLAGGAIEAHFMFFVMIIVISLYEDWRPFLLAFGFVVAHHGLMGVFDRSSVYNHPGDPWVLALIHGAFVAAAGVACVVHWRMNEKVRAAGHRASERALESDARFRSAFEDGPIGMALVETTAAGPAALVQVNRTLCEQFGYREEELIAADLFELVEPVSMARLAGDIEALVAGQIAVAHDELRLAHHDGYAFEGRVSMSLVAGTAGAARDLIVQIEDVTERNVLKRELQDLADRDPLTGLLNRRSFGLELGARLGAGGLRRRGGAVVLIDLDAFKEVNDTLGHEVGDRLLASVAAALQDASREDDAVARLGGDEFALLIDATTADQAARVGARIVQRVRQRAVTGRGSLARRTTASVGIVVYSPTTELTGDQLLNDADLAMYEAKDNGGNRSVVYAAEAGNAGSGDAPSWPDRIRRALDDERFAIYAQPILDLGSGAVTSFELLLRMIGADGEIISPGAFLPVAERRGMIRTIDRWVIRQAVGLLHDLETDRAMSAGPAVRLHVNISGRSLSDADFLEYIRKELKRGEVDPSQLVFEITETAAIANVDDARRFLTSLSQLGCGIALDDFGAGFGSFHYLKNLPVDILKIDGQFIQNLLTNPDDLVVVQSLVRMARGLRMRTAAEYIVDAATQRLLGELGVDLAQGYHIGRPGPVRQVIKACWTPASAGPAGDAPAGPLERPAGGARRSHARRAVT
jgi:diguanylate cyclase (GGDEF)-like protein/PAS domain S-box-containing protein